MKRQKLELTLTALTCQIPLYQRKWINEEKEKGAVINKLICKAIDLLIEHEKSQKQTKNQHHAIHQEGMQVGAERTRRQDEFRPFPPQNTKPRQ